MNVAFGGTLHQHLPDMPGMLEHGVPVADTISTHDVKPAPGSRLLATAGVDVLSCSSHHHQGVDRVAEGLVATGWSDDGLVEAIELRSTIRTPAAWMLGVQWHPEDTAASDPAQQALFDGLALLAKWRGSRAKARGDARAEPRVRTRRLRPGVAAGCSRARPRLIRDALGDLAVRHRARGLDVGARPGRETGDRHPGLRRTRSRRGAAGRSARRRSATSTRIDPIETEHEFLSIGYDDDDPRKVHIHLCEVGGEWERRHLAFRDELRRDPDTAG